MKTLFSIFSVIILLFSFTHAEAAETVIKARLLGGIRNLDAAKIRNMNDYMVAYNIYSNLVRYKPGTTEIEPDLAHRWEVSSDGKVYTFYLRKNVKWHKGYGEFTSKDVKYSIERILDKKTKSPSRRHLPPLEKIELIDDYTVKFILKKPFAPFLKLAIAYRAGMIVNEAAVKKLGKDYSLNPVGTGPFVFEKYITGSDVILKANKEYYLSPPKVDKIIFKPISDDAVAEIALEKGDIDLMYLRSSEVYNRLKKKKGIVVDEKVGLGIYSLVFNLSKKPFDNIKVRKAIHHAINKDQIVNVLFSGIAIKGVNVIAPNFFSFTEDVPKYEYSIEKAKKLLKEAGFENGFKTTLHYSKLAPWPYVVPAIQSDLKKVGIQVELKPYEHAVFMPSVRKRKYAFAVHPNTRPPDPDIVFSQVYHSTGVNNCTGYSGIDDLIEKARVETSIEQRKKYYQELQRKVMADTPTICLFHMKKLQASREYVKGHPVNLLNEFFGDSVYIEK